MICSLKFHAGGQMFCQTSCCHHLSWRHQPVQFLQREVELHQFFLLSKFFPAFICAPVLSPSLVTINGHFHPSLASVMSITAGRGKVPRTPAASKAVVIHKWSPILSTASRPPLAALGAARHQCNAAVVVSAATARCVVAWQFLQGCPVSLTHRLLLSVTLRGKALIGLFQHLSYPDRRAGVAAGQNSSAFAELRPLQ